MWKAASEPAWRVGVFLEPGPSTWDLFIAVTRTSTSCPAVWLEPWLFSGPSGKTSLFSLPLRGGGKPDEFLPSPRSLRVWRRGGAGILPGFAGDYLGSTRWIMARRYCRQRRPCPSRLPRHWWVRGFCWRGWWAPRPCPHFPECRMSVSSGGGNGGCLAWKSQLAGDALRVRWASQCLDVWPLKTPAGGCYTRLRG